MLRRRANNARNWGKVPNLFTVANSHYQPSWQNQIVCDMQVGYLGIHALNTSTMNTNNT